jgi:Ca-activated chloride channel family protein
MTFEAQTDRQFIRTSGRSVRYVLVSHVAAALEASRRRPAVNVALVLDRSGSMGGQKIRLAREAVIDALRMLGADDRFAIVSYDDQIDVVVESTHATDEALRNAIESVQRIEARGSTDLGGGYLRGCEQIAGHLSPDTVGRCLLVTDGLANRGITSPEALAQHAAELLRRGVATSTFGIGADFNELLLQGMATRGGGHSYFIEVAANIRDCLTGELGEALEVTERDVELRLQLPCGVTEECVTMHDARPAAADGFIVRLGDLVARQESAVVLALTFPEGEEGILVPAALQLRGRDGELAKADVRWTFRSHDDNDRQARDVVVDRAVARAYAARVRHEASALNERGEFDRSRAALLACAKKIRSYADNDRELLALARELEADAVRFGEEMTMMLRKQVRYASYFASTLRAADGKSLRREEPAK